MYIDPAKSPWFPRCIFKLLTGWDCPFCGTQRAVHCLLHLDFAGALRYNAFLVVIVPVLGAMGVAYLLRGRWPRFYAFFENKVVIAILMVLVVGWWIGRNLWF